MADREEAHLPLRYTTVRQPRPSPDAPDSPWHTQSARETYRNPWVVVTEHQVIRPDGQPGIYGVVDPGDNVTIVARDEGGRVLLVRDFIYPMQQWAWSLPSGAVESGEDPFTAAVRELREEGGVRARRWGALGSFWTTPGIAAQTSYLFLARDLEAVAAHPEPTEVITHHWMALADALALCQRGEIRHALAALALHLVAAQEEA
jgi:8-oxo-dGTP pyrophosphatase MutT (NUDIX family)